MCISDYARDSILDRLRRDRALPIRVAHPGGDHLESRSSQAPAKTRFTRLGTLEARKRPVEILEGFKLAVDQGLDAELLYIGKKSSSDEAINQAIQEAIDERYPVVWVQGASDTEVYNLVNESSVFLSIGIEGYGIPVLEAIRVGTPVIFDGVQPAGELMVGKGALHVPCDSSLKLKDMFIQYGNAQALANVRAELSQASVPTWRNFAEQVAHVTQH